MATKQSNRVFAKPLVDSCTSRMVKHSIEVWESHRKYARDKDLRTERQRSQESQGGGGYLVRQPIINLENVTDANAHKD